MSWDYTTLNGQAIVIDQPYTHDRANPEYLIPFFVSWNGSGWHIADQLAQTGSIASLNIPPSCYPLEAAISLGNGDIGISRNSLGNVTIGDQIQSLYWELYASGPVMASGCLLAASQNPPNPQAPITSSDLSVYNLYRFGMMLTVNSTAHSYFPNFPVVDSYEQQIAQSIARQNHLVIK